jgi:hypothetical protein
MTLCSRTLSWVALALASVLAAAPRASAQVHPTATVLATQRIGVDEGTGAAFDRTVRARLDALDVVEVQGAVTLDLEQIQLALGCMGETTACLAQVATEMSSEIILVPSLATAGETLQATILIFDSRDSTIRRTTREASGHDASSQILGNVEGMLREAFGLPAAVARVEGPEGPVTPPSSPGLSPVPFVLIGIGAAALIGGAIAGGLYLSDANLYMQPIETAAQRDELDVIRDRGNAEGLASTILLIGGGVLAATGLIWLLAAGNDDGSSPLAVIPMVSPDGGMLTLHGTFGDGF